MGMYVSLTRVASLSHRNERYVYGPTICAITVHIHNTAGRQREDALGGERKSIEAAIQKSQARVAKSRD
jgi:hypothetical protein